MTGIEKYVRVIDGEECLSAEAVGILAGQTADQIRAEFERQRPTGRFAVPQAWRRGAKEMQAKYGTTSGAEILAQVLIERGEI